MIKIDLAKLNKDQRRLIDKFLRLRKRMKDLSDYWNRRARPIIIADIKKVFDTDGHGRWQKRKDNKSHPLLRLSEQLYRSWTKRGAPFNINIVTKNKLVWGTRVFYGIFHELGVPKKNLPKRSVKEPLLQGGKLERRLSESLYRYLLKSIND